MLQEQRLHAISPNAFVRLRFRERSEMAGFRRDKRQNVCLVMNELCSREVTRTTQNRSAGKDRLVVACYVHQHYVADWLSLPAELRAECKQIVVRVNDSRAIHSRYAGDRFNGAAYTFSPEQFVGRVIALFQKLTEFPKRGCHFVDKWRHDRVPPAARGSGNNKQHSPAVMRAHRSCQLNSHIARVRHGADGM